MTGGTPRFLAALFDELLSVFLLLLVCKRRHVADSVSPRKLVSVFVICGHADAISDGLAVIEYGPRMVCTA